MRLHGLLQGANKCFIVASGVALLGYVLTPQTLETLGKLRQFSPVTVVKLLNDSLVDCLPNSSSNRLETRPQCEAQPILGEWPNVGHWAAPLSWPVNLFVAALDVAWHLIFTRQVVPAFVSVIQILLGFGISALIAQRMQNWNDYWLTILLAIGTPIIGAAAVWIILNMIGILYEGLSSLIPDFGARAVIVIAGVLGAECKVFALALKRFVVDRPADTLADRATKLIQRYVS